MQTAVLDNTYVVQKSNQHAPSRLIIIDALEMHSLPPAMHAGLELTAALVRTLSGRTAIPNNWSMRWIVLYSAVILWLTLLTNFNAVIDIFN